MDAKAMAQMLVSGQSDLEWFASHKEEFKSKFNNKFVAFRDKSIISSDSDIDMLMKKLKKKKVSSSDTFIEYVSKTRLIL